MKITIKKPVEIDIAFVRCDLPVRYEEEDMPNNYPLRSGDVWNIVINADTGQILDWPKGTTPRGLFMKVCDEGCYYLVDRLGNTIWSREQNYVPSFIPGEYGDYIKFEIDSDGVIANWKDRFTAERLQDYLDDSES